MTQFRPHLLQKGLPSPSKLSQGTALCCPLQSIFYPLFSCFCLPHQTWQGPCWSQLFQSLFPKNTLHFQTALTLLLRQTVPPLSWGTSPLPFSVWRTPNSFFKAQLKWLLLTGAYPAGRLHPPSPGLPSHSSNCTALRGLLSLSSPSLGALESRAQVFSSFSYPMAPTVLAGE